MRKTRGVTKYEPRWQLLRASVKGPKLPLQQKLDNAEAFFLSTPSYDNWERVTNWMEGVRIVYNKKPDSEPYQLIASYLERMQRAKVATLPKEKEQSDTEKLTVIKTFSNAELKLLWNDLFKRNATWSSRGYFHPEHNAFVALLAQVIEDRDLFASMKHKKEDWERQVSDAHSKPNTHKFFF